MASIMPINIPLPGEQAVASYSYEDIVNNFGILTFYAMATREAARTYRLSSSVFPSNSIDIATAAVNFTVPITFEADAFNTPRSIYGGSAKAFVPIEFYFYAPAGATPNYTCELKLYKKTPAAVETLVGEAKGVNPIYVFGDGGQVQVYFSINIPLTATNFAKGDKVVLKVTEISGQAAGTNSYLGHDPIDRKSGNIGGLSCLFKLDVPFRIDL